MSSEQSFNTSVKGVGFEILVTEDRLQVLMNCKITAEQMPAVSLKIETSLDQLGLNQAATSEEIAAVINKHQQEHGTQSNIVLLAGTPRIPFVDGRLEWEKEFFAKGFVVDEITGAVNFRQKLETRSVTTGQLLARHFPAKAGKAGIDVFGNPLPVGRPEIIRIRAGKGVNRSTVDGIEEFYSQVDGRIRYVSNTLTVDNVYKISGNVNLETGDISHTGAIVIEGDIEQGASVHADGDIEVRGIIEPSNITSGGSLSVNGGLVGNGENSINLDGDLQARYINEAQITVGGNLTVGGEVDHSNISCSGEVHVLGRIAGGEVIAMRGIILGQAGAEAGTKTLLAAGVDHTLETRLIPYREKVEKLEHAADKISAAVTEAQKRINKLSAEQKEQLVALKNKGKAIDLALEQEKEQIGELIEASKKGAIEKIEITTSLYAGLTVQLGSFRKKVVATVIKPRQIIRKKSKIFILPMGEEE